MDKICTKTCQEYQSKQDALTDALMLLSHVKLLINAEVPPDVVVERLRRVFATT